MAGNNFKVVCRKSGEVGIAPGGHFAKIGNAFKRLPGGTKMPEHAVFDFLRQDLGVGTAAVKQAGRNL